MAHGTENRARRCLTCQIRLHACQYALEDLMRVDCARARSELTVCVCVFATLYSDTLYVWLLYAHYIATHCTFDLFTHVINTQTMQLEHLSQLHLRRCFRRYKRSCCAVFVGFFPYTIKVTLSALASSLWRIYKQGNFVCSGITPVAGIKEKYFGNAITAVI